MCGRYTSEATRGIRKNKECKKMLESDKCKGRLKKGKRRKGNDKDAGGGVEQR